MHVELGNVSVQNFPLLCPKVPTVSCVPYLESNQGPRRPPLFFLLSPSCPFSIRSGELVVVQSCLVAAHRGVDSRSMSRNPRGPKRSPTPTSATFPDMPPPPVPSSPASPAPSKPLYLCSPFVEAALVKGNFKTIVVLPKYVDIMEWVAVNGASLPCLYGCHSDHAQCLTFIPTSTSFMGSSPSVAPNIHVLPWRPDQSTRLFFSPFVTNFLESLNYTWINQDRKSVHLAAPTYIDYVMTWVQNLLDDENVFPTKSGKTRTPATNAS